MSISGENFAVTIIAGHPGDLCKAKYHVVQLLLPIVAPYCLHLRLGHHPERRTINNVQHQE